MSTPKETGKKTRKPAKTGTEKVEEAATQKNTKADLVETMLEDFQKKVDEGKVKMTVGDYIRLRQLQNELEAEQPREIRVTWVEPAETESTNET